MRTVGYKSITLHRISVSLKVVHILVTPDDAEKDCLIPADLEFCDLKKKR